MALVRLFGSMMSMLLAHPSSERRQAKQSGLCPDPGRECHTRATEQGGNQRPGPTIRSPERIMGDDNPSPGIYPSGDTIFLYGPA